MTLIYSFFHPLTQTNRLNVTSWISISLTELSIIRIVFEKYLENYYFTDSGIVFSSNVFWEVIINPQINIMSTAPEVEISTDTYMYVYFLFKNNWNEVSSYFVT